MTQATGAKQTTRLAWETPTVTRLDANRAENGRLVGPEAVALLS